MAPRMGLCDDYFLPTARAVLVADDGYLTPEGWGALSGIVSSFLCFAFYKGLRPFSALLIPKYRKLNYEDKRNWDSRYSSNLHAAVCVLFGYILLVQSDFFWKEGGTSMFLRTNALSYTAMGTSFGYFVVDFVSCVKYNMGGAEMTLHHLGSLMAVATALFTGDGHMPTTWMLVTEFTTPLINNRWWLDKLDMKDHKLYVINGLSILFSWIFARMAIFPPFFYILLKHRQEIFLMSRLSVFLCMVVPVILAALNIYWFTKIVKGAYKVLFGRKEKQA